LPTPANSARNRTAFGDAICRFRRDPFDHLVKGKRRKEEPMETLIPLIAAVIILAALSVGESSARARRSAGRF
jgi:hypothetical protein